MSDSFLKRTQGVSLTGNGDSLVSDGGVYTGHQTRTQCRVLRTRDFSRLVFFFSRVSAWQRLSHA